MLAGRPIKGDTSHMNQCLIYLASASPRRSELLRQIGVSFRLMRVEVDESPNAGEMPQPYVLRLAIEKARRGCESLTAQRDACVLAADTAVVLDDRILGKPRDREHALDMLDSLSGREHQVMTAVAMCRGQQVETRLSCSQVRFRSISVDERQAYWSSGEPGDKAGGYAIQGLGALFVQELKGSFSGVVGLPLFETAELLALAGVNPLLGDEARL